MKLLELQGSSLNANKLDNGLWERNTQREPLIDDSCSDMKKA